MIYCWTITLFCEPQSINACAIKNIDIGRCACLADPAWSETEAGVLLTAGGYMMERFQRNLGARLGNILVLSRFWTLVTNLTSKLAITYDFFSPWLRPGHSRMDQIKQVIRCKLEETLYIICCAEKYSQLERLSTVTVFGWFMAGAPAAHPRGQKSGSAWPWKWQSIFREQGNFACFHRANNYI